MSLATGSRLGPYEILAPIGAGGMGEVYRARDTKLKRDVALKVLPDAFANDLERMTRFQREAEVLASLNHPNIASIYGVEDHALIMELVEGDSPKGPVPVDEAWRIAWQIVAALEYAHEKGIVHRDLKPANVKITPDGVVKLLDFGLAKAFTTQREAQANVEQSPTLTIGATEVGLILGTAAYMSPEQAKGKSVDKRADIWSFGVLLYELLAGERLFQGEDVSETLAQVLTKQPDLTRVPGKVRRLLGACLDKDPRQRLRDIGDARRLMDGRTEVAEQSKARRAWPWIVVGGAAALALVAALGWYNAARRVPLRPLMSLNLAMPDEAPLARTADGGMIAISPDGARLAVTLRAADGKVRLHTRLLHQNQFTTLVGTEDARDPFFSPDGEWIGFFADGQLKKIAVQGGATVTLCEAPAGRGASWGDDGNIIAALSTSVGLSLVPTGGGTPSPLTKLNPGEGTHRWPQVLPGSQAVLFTASPSQGNFDEANIEVLSLKSGERKTVQSGGFSPHYLSTSTSTGSNGTGLLVYLRQSTLFAVPFDLNRLALAGAPKPILEDVSSNGTAGGDFAFASSPSRAGTFIYLAGKGQRESWAITRLDSTGKTQPLQAQFGVYHSPRFSPDGKRLAFSMASGQGEDIWVKDLDRDTPSRLTFLAGGNYSPLWTPDGKDIVFQSSNAAAPGLYSVRSDGSAEPQRLTDGKVRVVPHSFSPDGKRLAFVQNGSGGSPDIFTAPVEGDSEHPRLGKPKPFLGTRFVEVYPAFSPDGHWLAYQSNESGTNDVYVRPFPGPGARWQISTGGGLFPLWSRDGRELLFQTLDQRVMAVSYTTHGDSFIPGKPRAWSEARLRNIPTFSTYDLAPDGNSIAAILADDNANGQKPPTHLTILVNFFDELRRRAAVGK
jgi:Tol biopolymer transport system component